MKKLKIELEVEENGRVFLNHYSEDKHYPICCEVVNDNLYLITEEMGFNRIKRAKSPITLQNFITLLTNLAK